MNKIEVVSGRYLLRRYDMLCSTGGFHGTNKMQYLNQHFDRINLILPDNFNDRRIRKHADTTGSPRTLYLAGSEILNLWSSGAI